MGIVLWNEEGTEHCDEFFVGDVRQRIMVNESLLVGVSCECC